MKRVWFTVLSTLAISFGFLAAPLRAHEFVYVVNFDSSIISGYYIIPGTGALEPLQTGPFVLLHHPRSIAVDPTGHFVYVANRGSATVSGYSIDRDGALTPVINSPFATGTGPISVAVDPAAHFVYVANEASNSVSGYRIIRDSAFPVLAPVGSFPTGPGPQSVAITPEQ